MTEIMRSVGIASIGAFMSFILKESGFRGSRLLSALVIVISFAQALTGIRRLIGSIFSFSLGTEIESSVGYVLKIVGVSYVFGISSDLCREIGEGGIAAAILTVGRVEIILLSLPAISEIISLAGELL